MNHGWDIEEQIFKGANIGAIEATWNRLVQENSTNDAIPMHRSNDSRDGMLCAKQAVAFCGFAQNLLMPSLFRHAAAQPGPPLNKWWESVDEQSDIAMEVSYAFAAEEFSVVEEASTERFVSNQPKYTHKGVVHVSYTVSDARNVVIGQYMWTSKVARKHQLENRASAPPPRTKRFSGLGPLFHIINGNPDCGENFCELVKHVTLQAPLHNDCVLRLHRAFQIFGEMHKFHLEMTNLFWTSGHMEAVAGMFTDFFIPYTPFAHSAEAETIRLSVSMERLHPADSSPAPARSIPPTTPYRGLLKGVDKFHATLVAAMGKFGPGAEVVHLFEVSILLDHVIKKMGAAFDEIYASYRLRLVECGGGALFSRQNLRVTLNTLKDRKARQEYKVHKGLFQYCDEDYVMTGYVSFPYKDDGGRIRFGKRHLLATMERVVAMTPDRGGMHTVDLGIQTLYVRGSHHIHVATLPNFPNQMPPRIKILGKGMYNGKPKIVMIGNTEGAANTVCSCFCGYLCPNFVQLVTATEHLSDGEFNSKLGLLNGKMTNVISQLREMAMAQHSICIDIVDFIPVLAAQLGFDEAEVESAGWPLHNCALELVKCGASLCNLESRRRHASDSSTLQDVLAEMQRLRKQIMESGKLQAERQKREAADQEREEEAKRHRTASCPSCDPSQYEAQLQVWKRNCMQCNAAHDHPDDDTAGEPVYRSLCAAENNPSAASHACGVAGAPGADRESQDEGVMVDDFDGSKQLNILKWLGNALEVENLGSATSYAILDADTPPMLAGDNIGKLPEEANTAPRATQYRQYGNTEEVQRFQLTLMMQNYHRQHKFLQVERYTLTVLYTRFKQEFASSLQMADQHDVTKTFPKIDGVVNNALDEFASSLK